MCPDPARLLPLIRPYPAERMEGYAVGRMVNDPKVDDPRCIGPVA